MGKVKQSFEDNNDMDLMMCEVDHEEELNAMSNVSVVSAKLGDLYRERGELESRIKNMKPLIDRLEEVLFDLQEQAYEDSMEEHYHWSILNDGDR